MNFTAINSFVCAKVSKTDAYSQARCNDYILARHKLIYESFDWKAAQTIVEKTIPTTGATVTTISIPELHHCLSVRLDGNLIVPVTASYIFENASETMDSYATAGVPLMYEEFNDPVSQVRSIRFFPPLADTGASHSLVILGKLPYNDAWTSPAIPQTENALIALVIGDMWEYLHQVGKAQAKFQEAAALLDLAQKADTPAPLRPRKSSRSSPGGNTFTELTDAVCDIIGDYNPPTRDNVRERIRRNYQTLWDLTLWPESTIVASVTANGSTVILPHLFDKIIAARVNLDPPTSPITNITLDYTNAQIWFGIKPDMFEQTGNPVAYRQLMPVALPVDINSDFLKLQYATAETTPVYLKGELLGAEVFETLTVTGSLTQTVNSYDILYTLSKPQTTYKLIVQNSAGTELMRLNPGETDRKYPRLRLYPAFTATQDQTVFVLGKRRVPQLLDAGDTVQLTGSENILIDNAAADMLLISGKPDVAQSFRDLASAALKTLFDRETNQATYTAQVLPYAEPELVGDTGFSIP